MKSSIKQTILTLAAASLFATAAVAQVPTMLSYQGRVLMNNTNFGGNGQFKFALVQGAGPTLLWKNDGSAGNTEPGNAVNLSVANGLVMTTLGDTTLLNMTALPASAFANADVRLRVWFNGGAGFQQLTPDQRIVSVGYALMANTVPDGSITTAKLAPGVLNPVNFPNNSVSSNQLADTISLGGTVDGRLDIYRTDAGGPGISMIGGSSRISTYGNDGLEQTRIHGTEWGEILLYDKTNNTMTARLSAGDDSGNFLSLTPSGGSLLLNSSEGTAGASLTTSSGGSLSLYQRDGNVGTVLDGDFNGYGRIDLRSTNGSVRARLNGGPGAGSLSFFESDGTETVTVGSQGNGTITLRQGDGSAAIGISANNGSGGGGLSVYRDTGAFAGQLTVSGTSGFLGLANSAGQNRFVGVGANAAGGAALYLYDSTGAATIVLDSDQGNEGRITTQVLTITGGSDLSENFDVNASEDELKPGMIVSIDPNNTGELVLSSKAYDKTVAGIISGAGGVKPGMTMGQAGTKADGKHPVALTGRVYCYVDADAGGAIESGDLITTSATPGHGMKASDQSRSHGTVIGKAMSSLDKGRGLVLVLVNLQ